MKKAICGILAIIGCTCLTGCFQKIENDSQMINKPNNVIQETDDTEIALSAIKEALKDDEWVKNNLMLRKSVFGDEAYDDQELNFEKIGKDRVIVNVFAYDQTFGIANTIVSYKDGEVRTFSEPSLDEPGHPGHIGYSVDKTNELLASGFMHMGFYETRFYKILDNSFELFASFEGTENNEDGTILEDEDGKPLVKYTIMMDGVEESGIMTFEEYDNKVNEYFNKYQFEAIDNILTDENVDLIL